MSQPLKTKPSDVSVADFLAQLDNAELQQDCQQLLAIMTRVTGNQAKLWGGKMIGFGKYSYKYASGHSGEWFVTGFATRKQGITIYIMPGFSDFDSLMSKLGKYKTGKSCLYIKSLADIDISILEQLIEQSVVVMDARYNNSK